MYTAYKVVFKDDNTKKDIFFCNICGFSLVTNKDFVCVESFDCCNECYLTFAEQDTQLWKDGQRPDKTTIETYIYKRKKIILGEKNEF